MKKQSGSLTPFIALPAIGAAAGGAYYLSKHYGDESDIDQKERAKRLLRCLVLGGVSGLGGATAYTGGKMVYDNLLKSSSAKRLLPLLLKKKSSVSHVKKASGKRLLVQLLKKADYEQIPEYDGNINTNYLIGGGIGLLGGLGLYHLLSDEKKRSLGGYLSAGLTGATTGGIASGLYNQTQHGKLFDEKNPLAGMYYKEVDKTKLPKPSGAGMEGKRFKTTTVNGKDVIYGEKPDYWKIEDDPDYVAPGSTTTTSSPSGGYSSYSPTGSVGGDIVAGVGTVAATGAGLGATKAVMEGVKSKSPSFGDRIEASNEATARQTRPGVFTKGESKLNRFGKVVTSPFRVPYNLTNSMVAWLGGLKPLDKDTYELYEKLQPVAENFTLQNATEALGPNPAAKTRASNILTNNKGNDIVYNPATRDATGSQKFINPREVQFATGDAAVQIADAHNKLTFWKAQAEMHPNDPVIKNMVALSEAAYRDTLDGKFKYSDVTGNMLQKGSPIADWNYYVDADPAKLTDLATKWEGRTGLDSAGFEQLVKDLQQSREYLPSEIKDLLTNEYTRTFNPIDSLTEAEAKNITGSRYNDLRIQFEQAVNDARTEFENAVKTNSPETTAKQKELIDAYNKLEELNRRYRDIPGNEDTAGIERPSRYIDETLKGLSDTDALQKEYDWVRRSNDPNERSAYEVKRNQFVNNNLHARFKQLKAENPTWTNQQIYQEIATGSGVPEIVQNAAKKKLGNSKVWNSIFNVKKPSIPPIPEPETSEIHTTEIPEEYRRLMEAVEQAKQNAADRAKVPPIPDTTPIPQLENLFAEFDEKDWNTIIEEYQKRGKQEVLNELKAGFMEEGYPEGSAERVIAEIERRIEAIQGNDVSAPNPTPGNVNNEAPSGSKPITGSGTPIDYTGYDYERLQKEVDTLDRAWKNLENARIKGTLNEKGKEALATTESQLNAARKELRSRPEFKASLNTPLPGGPNKPPKGTGAPKPNPVTGNNVWSVDTFNTGTPNGSVYTENTGNPWSDVVKTYQDMLSGQVSTELPPSEIPEVSQTTQGTPETQKGTPETVQNKQPKTWDDVLRESRSKWKPLEGSHYDKNYHIVVDNPEVYKKALEKEKAAIDKKLARPERLEVNERRALEQRKTWIGKTLDTVIRVGEKIVEVGKPVIRAAERAGRHL